VLCRATDWLLDSPSEISKWVRKEMQNESVQSSLQADFPPPPPRRSHFGLYTVGREKSLFPL
jgi:hypothetical protein